MVDVINEMLVYLLENYALYLVVIMGIIVSITIGVLSLVKRPIKHFTAKIQNERLRKLTNKVFIVMAFAISLACWALLNLIAPEYFNFDGLQILLTGAFSVVIYALGDGVITKSKAQQLVETINEVVEEENKNNNKEKSALKEYLKKVK